MGKYKNLLSNTLLFAVATFSSKLLSFLLTGFYTRVLGDERFGTAMLVITTCNLILPVMYLGISDAVIRFGLDTHNRKRDVFSTGIFTVLGGYGIFLLMLPAAGHLPFVGEYAWLIYIYILTSALRNVISNFVRASGFVRLFALDGMFTTITTITFNVIFLIVLDMGIPGYVLSTILADGLSALLLFVILRLHRFIKLRGIDGGTVKAMLRYSIPLIPTNVFWWVTNSSDQYLVAHYCGEAQTGLYTAAYRLPSMITLVSTIFIQAWQISAFSETEYSTREGARFFSTVFKSYYTFIFLAASGIILLVRPVINVWLGSKFYEAWRYVPFLVLAVTFSCLVTFLGTVYNAAKKNAMVTVTTFVGAGLNLGLNLLLIPTKLGPQGAAIATFVSYFVVFLIRAVDTQKLVAIRMQPMRLGLNLLLLLAQVLICLQEIPYGTLYQILIFLLLVVCNYGYILFLLRQFVSTLSRRKSA